jgi:hypothetical protein
MGVGMPAQAELSQASGWYPRAPGSLQQVRTEFCASTRSSGVGCEIAFWGKTIAASEPGSPYLLLPRPSVPRGLSTTGSIPRLATFVCVQRHPCGVASDTWRCDIRPRRVFFSHDLIFIFCGISEVSIRHLVTLPGWKTPRSGYERSSRQIACCTFNPTIGVHTLKTADVCPVNPHRIRVVSAHVRE